MVERGKYIGFTGIDGSGKSVQAALLCGWLTKQKIPNILREGKQDFIFEISNAIARKHNLNSGKAYLGEDLYMVSLSFDLLREVILDIMPYVKNGIIVVAPRTAFCRIAGAITRGCRTIEIAKEIAFFGGIPDLTIWLDTSPEVAHQRIISRGLDSAELDHLRNYRESLRQLLKDYPYIKVNGDRSIEDVQTEIQEIVRKKILKEPLATKKL